MFTGGVPATDVVFVENALPNRRSDAFGRASPRASRSIRLPSAGRGGSLPRGGLFVNLLPPSLSLHVLSCASSLPFSHSGSSDFFRPSTVCARCIIEMEPERGVLFAVLSFSGRSFEDVEVDELKWMS